MKDNIRYLVCIRLRHGFEGLIRNDLAYRYNMKAEEAINLMYYFNNLPNPHPGYRYIIQKQRTKYVKQAGKIYSGLTADPIIKYGDQFKPPYTAPHI